LSAGCDVFASPRLHVVRSSYNPHMTRRLLLLGALLAAAVAGGVAQAPPGAQSQGALGNRPGAGRDPEFPPPSIIDYKPKSTLVVQEHPVPRAKFPVIDIHSHQPAPI